MNSMKEEYLHFLWRMRCIPSRNLHLYDGKEIEIIDFGEYNTNESGPDFLHGKVIIEGILWFGSIEFHLKSSDWFKHGHQNDSMYDNVILHVVWEHDREVMNNGRNIPTLLLSQFINQDYTSGHDLNRKNGIILPCSHSLEEVKLIHIEKEKEWMLHERMLRKTAHLNQSENEGYTQVLYELLATAFGAKVNKDPFWELSRKIPIKRILKLGKNKRAALICETSGVHFDKELDINSAPGINKMADWQWKRKGLHPKGFPEIRIKQFAYFIEHFDFDFGFLQLSSLDLLAYLNKSFYMIDSKQKISQSFRNLVIMNSFVPFLWWLGDKRGDSKWQNLAIEILQTMPPETNHITKLLKSTGFKIQSAYDSQSLMELYNKRCTHKKCLTCTIGNDILNQ
jgi:hypothetical protein